MNILRKISKFLERFLFYFVAFTLGLLVVVSLAAVVLRFFRIPLVWSDEFMRYIFVWLVMMGSVLASSRNSQIYIDLVESFTPQRFQKITKTFNQIIVLAFFAFLLYHSSNYIELGFQQISSALRWPMIWVYISFPIAFVFEIFMSIRIIAEIWGPTDKNGKLEENQGGNNYA
jgi:TRAP-type C4-dicarboxylate transport system permease small subunit